MNPILEFYRGDQVVKILGQFPCEHCSKVTYAAVYEIEKRHTFWNCQHCNLSNSIEGTEMEYEREV